MYLIQRFKFSIKKSLILLFIFATISGLLLVISPASAKALNGFSVNKAVSLLAASPPQNVSAPPGHRCGKNPGVKTQIAIGCTGKVTNPIVDLMLAIVKFLTVGATLAVTGSLVVAGIQYTAAGSSAENTAKAKKRIISSLTALFIFLFGWAILNYLIPFALLK